ncbi:MAG TPA: hypothetical protein VKD08_02440 [Ignavibacteriaceae bacterium]|jgi:hypothetical protein|nr:hypothetical protein [Ignavibacteriaceae bacterium]
MAEQVKVDEVSDAMFRMIKDSMGQKKWKATDLTKAVLELYGDRCDKMMAKSAIRELIESGKCVYTYFGGSFIEIPHKEGAEN